MTKDVDLCRQDERRHWFFRAKRGKLYSCAKTQKPCPDDFAARLFAFRAVQGSPQPISMDFGRRISVSRPWGLTLRAVMAPPCAVTLRLAMASPRPNPVPVRTLAPRTKGENMPASSSSGMPGPSSLHLMMKLSASEESDRRIVESSGAWRSELRAMLSTAYDGRG